MAYEDLKSFQQAKTIYDLTNEFCKLYVDKKSRTYDQMIQAARSGKQNIAEGSAQSKQKPKSEIYLLSIASASLKELLEDYQDFLRQKNLLQWAKDGSKAKAVRQLVYKIDKLNRTYKTYLKNAEAAANMIICLINQTTYLIDQQIRAIEKQMKEKGINIESENQRLGRVLRERRRKNDEFDQKLQEIIAGKRSNLDDD